MLLIVFISNIFVAAKVKDTNLHIVRTVPEVAIKNTQGLIWMLYTFDSNLLTKLYNWRWFPLYNTIRESCFYSCIKQAVGHRSAWIIWVTSFSFFVLFIIFFLSQKKTHQLRGHNICLKRKLNLDTRNMWTQWALFIFLYMSELFISRIQC